MRRPIDAKGTTCAAVAISLTVMMSWSAVAKAESLFGQLYGSYGGERPDRRQLYWQGEDAPYLASQNLWESRRVRSLAATYGIEAAISQDETVKPGDIVSTPEGLKVFMVSRNADGDRVGKLVPLQSSSLKANGQLQAIDRAVRSGR